MGTGSQPKRADVLKGMAACVRSSQIAPSKISASFGVGSEFLWIKPSLGVWPSRPLYAVAEDRVRELGSGRIRAFFADYSGTWPLLAGNLIAAALIGR